MGALKKKRYKPKQEDVIKLKNYLYGNEYHRLRKDLRNNKFR